MFCFASPEWGVQNRYWVNTTRFVYAKRVVFAFPPEFTDFEKKEG